MQAVAVTTQLATPGRTIQVQAASQTPTIRSPTVVVNSAGSAVSLAQNISGTPTKIVVASQGSVPAGAVLVSSPQSTTATAGTISIMTSSGPGIARIISPVKGGSTAQVLQKVGVGGTVMAVTNTPQGPRIIRQIATPQIVVQGQQQQQQQQSIQLKQQQLQQQQQVLAQQQAQLKAVQQQQIKLPTGQIIQVAGTGQQTITVTPQQLAALQQQQQLKQIKPAESSPPATTVTTDQQTVAVTQAGEAPQEQFVKQVQQTPSVEAKPVQVQTSVKSPTPGSPPAVPAATVPKMPTDPQNKYAVTPQVVQEGMN